MASPYTTTLFTLTSLLLSSIPLTSSTTATTTLSGDITTEAMAVMRMEKTSHLHFYFQDRIGSPNPTAVRIIGGPGQPSFGTTVMIDDALTRRPERDSEVVGRAQGTYSIAAQNDLAFLMVVNFCFSKGKLKGSSLSMLGRNHVMDEVREMPIVGGSGAFRFARGYALAHTVWFDPKTGDATVEYNVSVVHF